MEENRTTKLGFLLINKPAGMTSHDVVNVVRKKTGERKIGHAGTLDPMATGLLILAVGKFTKRIKEFSGLDKNYEAEITLGAESDTDDAMGEIKTVSSFIPKENEIAEALQSLTGEIEQVPPKFSAKKIGGQTAYKLARKGKTFELKPQKVIIYELKLGKYSYPKLNLICRVSSGTYIRAIARDLGKLLGTGGYLSKLKRTRIGSFRLENANDLDDNFLNFII